MTIKNDDAKQSFMSTDSEGKYMLYKYRYLIAVIYSISSILNAAMWISYSPILTNLVKWYDSNLTWVNFGTSLIWLAVYAPMGLVANYILDEKGLLWGMTVGNMGTIIGLWVRCFSKISFNYIFLGQLIGALVQPCILNAPQKVSAVWFPPSQRTLATTALSIANPLGVGIGFFLAQFFVTEGSSTEEGLQQVFNLNLFQAILTTALLVPGILLFRDKPPTPPSKGADTEKLHYKDSLRALFKNSNFVLFFFAVGSLWGAYNIMAIVLQPMMKPFGFSDTAIGNFGALNLVCGLVGASVFGVYVQETLKFKKTILICSGVSCISLVTLVPLAYMDNPWIMGGGVVIFGFFTTPLLPILFELSVEITFPVNEAASGGLMITGTQVVAIIGSLLLDIPLENHEKIDSVLAISVIAGLEFLGFIGFLFTKEDLRRQKAEGKYEKLRKSKIEPHEDEDENSIQPEENDSLEAPYVKG